MADADADALMTGRLKITCLHFLIKEAIRDVDSWSALIGAVMAAPFCDKTFRKPIKYAD